MCRFVEHVRQIPHCPRFCGRAIKLGGGILAPPVGRVLLDTLREPARSAIAIWQNDNTNSYCRAPNPTTAPSRHGRGREVPSCPHFRRKEIASTQQVEKINTVCAVVIGWVNCWYITKASAFQSASRVVMSQSNSLCVLCVSVLNFPLANVEPQRHQDTKKNPQWLQ